VEKLQVLLKQRGVTLSAAALATGLATEAVIAAPAGLATIIAGTALAGAATSGTALAVFKVMTLTKLKFGILGAIAVAGVAAPLIVQHQSVCRLREENHLLRQQQAQMAQLAVENERLSNLLAQANSAQALPQDQLHELLRLRGEVGSLRQQSKELARLQEDNRQLRARPVAVQPQTPVPFGPTPAPDDVARSTCIDNLRRIDGAIQQCALDNHLTTNDTVTAEQILAYLKRGKDVLRCPSGGTYTFGAITNVPTCSIPGHAIPAGAVQGGL